MAKWISPELVKKAKDMDLLTYLRNYEPGELVHVKGNQYRTRSHDSLKISNGKWMWWSEGIGGRSALDYLIKVRSMSFQDAVEAIVGYVDVREPVYVPPEPEKKEELYVPKSYPGETAYAYLVGRGLDEDILVEQYYAGNIYETEDHHNVAFVGKDADGGVRLVTLRGTKQGSSFKNTTRGSDRRFPFVLRANVQNSVVHVFESPIDALSYATLMKQMGMDYKQHNYMALCGIYRPKDNPEESAVPSAVTQYLADCPYTKTVCLHLDTDEAGKKAAEALQIVIGRLGVKVLNQPPPEGYKDCNEYLMHGGTAEPALER